VLQLLCGVGIVAAVVVASRHSLRVDLLRFPLAWGGVLLALDGLARWRRGSSPLRTPADWAATAAASILVWDLFELVNLRLRNWWYVGVPADAWAGSAFAAVSFATVLPAVRLGLAQLQPEPVVPAPEPRPLKAALGVAMLAAVLAWPRLAFPFAWIFLWPVCEALAGARVRLQVMALGIPLGILWEALNWGCARGWIYTVPFLDRPKLFEMPLPGYLGYLPFALECAAALAVLDRLRPWLRGRRGAVALLAVLAVHAAIDGMARGQTALTFSR
jgi:hypothetical protein